MQNCQMLSGTLRVAFAVHAILHFASLLSYIEFRTKFECKVINQTKCEREAANPRDCASTTLQRCLEMETIKIVLNKRSVYLLIEGVDMLMSAELCL